MARSRWLAAPILVLLSLGPVGACDGDGGGGGGPVPASQLYETWASTFCDVLTSCETSDDDFVVFTLMAKADKAACRSFVAGIFEAGRPESNTESLIAAGRIVYHAEQLSTCMAAARSQCSLELDEVPECRAVLEGAIATDGECWTEEECAGDALCAQNDSDCPGTCQDLPKRGEDCDWQCSQTEGPTSCGSASTCVPLTVTEGRAAGETCGTEYGETQVVSRRCASGLYCDYDSDTSESTCHAFVGLGETCGDGVRCSGSLACVPSGSDGGYACTDATIVSTVGAACNETDPSKPLVGCNLFARLACEAGTCQALGDGSAGSRCAPNTDIDGICDFGTYCDDATAECTPVKADGASCESGSECNSGVCVYDGTGAGTCGSQTCE